MLWQLPNASRFLDGVVESLALSKHAIVILPETILDSDPVLILSRRLSLQGLGSLTKVSLRHSEHEDILDAIVEELGFDACEIVSNESFLDREDVPSRYIAITGVEAGGTNWMSSLSALMSKAGEHAQNSECTSFSLVVFATPRFSPPPSNLMLAHHHWWGILSSVDIDHATESCVSEYPPSCIAEYYWLWAMCRGVAKIDPHLAQLIVEMSPKSVDELCELFSSSSSYTISDIPHSFLKYPEMPLNTVRVNPPVNGVMRDLWRCGHLDWHSGSGLVLHPHLLSSCGLQHEITRMVLKGQMQIILPLVEQVRQSLIYWIIREYGEDWINKLVGSLSNDDLSGLKGEIGPLCHFIFGSKSQIRRPSFKKISDMAWKWRNIRNEISHGRPISFDRLCDACEAFDSLAKVERLYDDFLEIY